MQSQYLPVNPENIPDELIRRDQWANWRAVERNGKLQKVPTDVHSGKNATCSDPKTWAPFGKVVSALSRYPGISYALSENDGIIGVDLDGVRDPDTGRILDSGKKIIEGLDTYTEFSPSASGLRAYGYANLAADAWHKKDLPDQPHLNGRQPAIEMYCGSKFLTTTGQHVPGTPPVLKDCSKAITELQARFRKERAQVAPASRAVGITLEDETLLQKARNAANGEKFGMLWGGDWAKGYGSQSEGDMALCVLLAFWTAKNAVQMDRLFRQSGLMRRKWDEQHFSGGQTYGQATVAAAVGYATEVYRPVFNCTDYGNAERMASQHGQDIRYCHTDSTFSVYQDGIWLRDDTAEVMRRAKATVRSIDAEVVSAETDEQRTALRKHAHNSEKEARITAMVNLLRSEPEIPVRPEDFDRDGFLLGVENGVVDLRKGQLRAARREDLITKRVPVAFDAAAICPQWDGFLSQIMAGDTDLIAFLWRAIGYTLSSDVSEQVLFFLHGTGSNGKSTFLRILLRLLGDYGTQAAPGLLLEHRGERHTTDIAELRRRRLVVSTEAGEGKRLAEELVKQLTGGDKIKGRLMRQDNIEFDPEFKLWLAANHKPVIKGTDYAIWRRIPLIPFNVTFKDPEQAAEGDLVKDTRLLDKLYTELPGILAKAVKGCLGWQREGLKIPALVQSATKNYRDEMDTLAGFIEDRCDENSGALIGSTDLYNAYLGWCVVMGETPKKQKPFSQALKDKGYEQKRTGQGQRFIGIALKQG